MLYFGMVPNLFVTNQAITLQLLDPFVNQIYLYCSVANDKQSIVKSDVEMIQAKTKLTSKNKEKPKTGGKDSGSI